MNEKRFAAAPAPPFDFNLSAQIFSGGDPQIRRYENGKFWQVLVINGKLVLTTVQSTGTVEKPGLSVELKSDKNITANDAEDAKDMVSSIFNLELDIEGFYADIKTDRTLSKITRKLYGLKSPTTPTVYEALVCSITEQQISIKAAHNIQQRLVSAFGDSLEISGAAYHAFPVPDRVVRAPLQSLRDCGLSSKKAEYIRNISKSIIDGKLDLERFESQRSTEKIIEELDEIPGIGVWTAEMAMLRGMRRFEAIPADDLGLRRDVSRYYCHGREISGEDVRGIAEKWGKWKGLAGFYLMMASALEL